MKQIYLISIFLLFICMPASASYDYAALSLTGLDIPDIAQIDTLLDQLQDDPNQAELWSKVAGIYLVKREYEKAITAYNYALTLNPKQVLSWKGLGYAHLHQDDYENGILAHEEALRLAPQDINQQKYLARLYNDIGEYERAMELNMASGTPIFSIVRYKTGPCSWLGESSGTFIIMEHI